MELKSIGDIAATWAIGAEDIEMRRPRKFKRSNMTANYPNNVSAELKRDSHGWFVDFDRTDSLDPKGIADLISWLQKVSKYIKNEESK